MNPSQSPPDAPASFIIKGGVSAPRLIDDIIHTIVGSRYLSYDPVSAANKQELRTQRPWSMAVGGDVRIQDYYETQTHTEFYSILFNPEESGFLHLNAEIYPGAAPPSGELLDFHLVKSDCSFATPDEETYEYRCSVTATRLILTFRRPIFTDQDWSIFQTEAIEARFNKYRHLSANPPPRAPSLSNCFNTLYKITAKPLMEPNQSPIYKDHYSVNVRTTPEFLIKHLHFTLHEDNRLYPPDIFDVGDSPELLAIHRDYVRKLHEIVFYYTTFLLNLHNQPTEPNPIFSLRDTLPVLRRLLFDNDPRVDNYLRQAQFYGNPHVSGQRGPSESELQMYTLLGATYDLSDLAISKRYDLQAFQDPANKPFYFEALMSIAQSRRRELLETKATELLSMGEVGAASLLRSYELYYINFDPNTQESPIDEDFIIDSYKYRSKESPQEEPNLRSAMTAIANHRQNAKLLAFLENKTMSLGDAYHDLGINKDSNEEYIHLAYETKMQEASPEAAKSAKLALRVIAVARKSKMLLNLYETAVKDDPDADVNKPISLDEAIALLKLSKETVEESRKDSSIHSLIVQHFEMNSTADPDSILEQRKALRVISKHLKSKKINQYLSGAPDSDFIRNGMWPVGLENIGNTCYLNSLLQFYFTISPLRNAVIEFCDNRNQLDFANAKEKRVGGRVVTKAEILRSREFVNYLGELFKELIHTPSASIAPKKELAYLALVQSQIDPRMEDYEDIVKKSEQGLNPIISSLSLAKSTPADSEACKELVDDDDDETTQAAQSTVIVHDSDSFDDTASARSFLLVDAPKMEEDGDLIPLASVTSVPDPMDSSTLRNAPKLDPAVTLTSPSTLSKDQDDDIVMVDAVLPSPESPKRNRDALSPGGSSHTRKKDRKNIEDGQDADGDDNMHRQGSVVSIISKKDTAYSSTDRKESVITVRSIDPPKTTEQKKQMDDALAIGGQQDVTECIENVLFQIEGAFEPIGQDEDGEQLDLVKELFYGATKQLIEDPETGKVGESKTERFSMLIVNVEDKPQNMYEVIDTYFDDSLVELGKKQVIRHITATKLPPILQVQIQRVQFDKVTQRAYKSKAPIHLLDTIYLDRYIDSDDPVMVEKRKEVAQWKARISRLRKEEEDMNQIVGNGLTIAETLESAKNFLLAQNKALAEGKDVLAGVAPSTIEFLEKHLAQFKLKQSSIRAEIALLESKLDHQFDDMRRVGYKLHSVFIHRGQATFGHYWVHIHDFKTNVYRTYNDKIVSEANADEVLGNAPKGSMSIKDAEATAYYVTYVREDNVSLVDAVVRDIVEEEEEDADLQDTQVDPVTSKKSDEMLIDLGDSDEEVLIVGEHKAQAPPPLPSRAPAPTPGPAPAPPRAAPVWPPARPLTQADTKPAEQRKSMAQVIADVIAEEARKKAEAEATAAAASAPSPTAASAAEPKLATSPSSAALAAANVATAAAAATKTATPKHVSPTSPTSAKRGKADEDAVQETAAAATTSKKGLLPQSHHYKPSPTKPDASKKMHHSFKTTLRPNPPKKPLKFSFADIAAGKKKKAADKKAAEKAECDEKAKDDTSG